MGRGGEALWLLRGAGRAHARYLAVQVVLTGAEGRCGGTVAAVLVNVGNKLDIQQRAASAADNVFCPRPPTTAGILSTGAQ